MIIKGQKINDRYQIIRAIGEGGMANVYLAYDTILDRNVAVKILRGDLATDEKFVRRFQREAISASSLSHPNIVEMYDVGEDDGNYFIVMEYVDGKTLKSLIKKRGSLTIPEVIDIMLQLTSAISCAHDSYIIHRDIKPQNVMIIDDGRVKITDFGIAIASNATELTQTNSVMGSVHYLPPEQANGQGATIKSDIYSLGILMFELLTGKVPFRGENAVEIALKQMKEPLPSICKINEDVPQRLENIVLKACAKNPRNRYDNTRQMYEDLKACLDDTLPDEKRLVYKYPEDELESTREINELKELSTREEKTKKAEQQIKTEKEKEEEVVEEEQMAKKGKNKDKKINIALWILLAIATIIVFVIGYVIFLYPKMNDKEISIPDVSGMTLEDATLELERLGLKVNEKVIEEESDEVKEGLIITSSPSKGRKVKKGYSVKLTISVGTLKVQIDDYKDMNYSEIKHKLEEEGLKVTIEKKNVVEDEETTYDADLIIDQSVEPGEKIEKGEEIILYIPNVIATLPDFTDGYTVDQIKTWCTTNEITCEIIEKETNDYKEGSIYFQSIAVGTRVDRIKRTVNIYVAKKVPAPVEENKEEEQTT